MLKKVCDPKFSTIQTITEFINSHPGCNVNDIFKGTKMCYSHLLAVCRFLEQRKVLTIKKVGRTLELNIRKVMK
jgi:hypothetical protein